MIDVLTSYRFIAALMVFVWHTKLFAILLDRYQLGYVGVSFFYVLSGFILAYVYSSKIKKLFSNATFNFVLARLAKIYPLHILTMLFAIPLCVVLNYYPSEYQWISVIESNTLLIQSWFSNPLIHFGLNGVSWSISVELFFYLCFPILLILITRYRNRLSTINIVSGLSVLWIIAIIIYSHQNVKIDEWSHYILPIVRLPEFVAGVLLYQIFKNNPLKKKYLDAYGNYAELLAFLMLFAAIVFSSFLPQSLRFGIFILPFLMIFVYIFSHQAGFISKILSLRFFVFLGEISFSFYMIHVLVINYLKLGLAMNFMISMLALTISIGLSIISYLFYEEPLRKKIRYLFNKNKIK